MRVVFNPPSEADFKRLFAAHSTLSLLRTNGGGLNDIKTFTPLPRRRGGGIFSSVFKTVLPFIMKTAKPIATKFGKNVLKDVITDGKSIKQSLKSRSVDALKDVGRNVFIGRVTKKKKKAKGRKPIKDVYSLL